MASRLFAIAATALLLVAAVSATAHAPSAVHHGSLVGLDGLLNVLTFDPVTGAAKSVGTNIPFALDASNGAAVDTINGIYYVAVANMTNGHATVVGISMKDGSFVRSIDISQYASSLYAMLGTELQFDPYSRILYVCAWDPNRINYRILSIGRSNLISVVHTFPTGFAAIPDGPGTYDYVRGVITLALYTTTVPTTTTGFFSVDVRTGQVVGNLTNVQYNVLTMNWDPINGDIWLLARESDFSLHLLLYGGGKITDVASLPNFASVVGGVSALDLKKRILTAVMSPLTNPFVYSLVSVDLTNLKLLNEPYITQLPINLVYY